jgi:hypothetical protein
VPEPTPAAARKARAREADRRRQAVTLLNVAGGTLHYAVRQLGNGLSPEEARTVALESAAVLAETADALRRLTRLSGAERRRLARQLAALGVPTRRIAAQVGVSERSVRYYVAGR